MEFLWSNVFTCGATFCCHGNAHRSAGDEIRIRANGFTMFHRSTGVGNAATRAGKKKTASKSTWM